MMEGFSNGRRSSFVSWTSVFAHSILAAVLPYQFGTFVVLKNASSPSNNHGQRQQPRSNFPLPLLHRHKSPPAARYSGQCLDDPHSEDEKTGNWSQHRVDVHLHIESDHFSHDADHNSTEEMEIAQQTNESEAELGEGFDGYMPAGQHMLMDIQNVNPNFLRDMQGMANSMVQTTTQSGLTLLSYHCHDLHAPMGISCVGVLLESHVSIHTWPDAGILSLDLFTCGPASLLPLLPLLESLFAIPAEGPNAPKPVYRWLYKKRGFRDYHGIFDTGESAAPVVHTNAESVEVEHFFLGWAGYNQKKVVADLDTKFQEVGIFEMYHSQEPMSRTAEAATRPNKKLFLDGVSQSSLRGLEAYHESLVHPTLITHPNPRRVAIIGGGEGATLREVLKHKTVETCAMLEIDRELVELARDNLSEWNDCSDLTSVPSDGTSYFPCFEDPRAEMHYVDAIQWIMDRFGGNASISEEKFDVIIMDALDPSSHVPFSDVLYGNPEFAKALVNAMTPSGVLIVQVGISENCFAHEDDPGRKMLDRFTGSLQQFGAKTIKSFVEAHGEFLAPWSFRAVFMDDALAERWHKDASQVDVELTKRAVQTKSGLSPFRYFDGASHQSSMYPSSMEEHVFCSKNPTPQVCLENPRPHDPKRDSDQTLAKPSSSELFDPVTGRFVRSNAFTTANDLLLSMTRAGAIANMDRLRSSLDERVTVMEVDSHALNQSSPEVESSANQTNPEGPSAPSQQQECTSCLLENK